MDTDTGRGGDECDALFVIRAKGMTFDGTKLALSDTDPFITYFCDRAVRSAGHLTIEALNELVSTSKNNFVEHPPDAAISVFNIASRPEGRTARGDAT